MHHFYYKRIIKDSNIVFAITEKGTYYQIIRSSMTTQQKDYYMMYLECEYADCRAWYSEDEREFEGSRSKAIVVKNKMLKDFLKGKNCDELEHILKKYDFDSKIVKFLSVDTVDGYTFWLDGFCVSTTEITKDKEKTTYYSSIDIAPIKTIKDLNLDSNKKFIAGLSIKEPNEDVYLISLDENYISADGFDKDTYLKKHSEMDNTRVKIMSENTYTSKHENCSANDKEAEVPLIEILPRIGVLIWEFEEDGIKLKSAPQYVFIDLNDHSNIKQIKIDD